MHPEDRNRWLMMIVFAAIAMIVVQVMSTNAQKPPPKSDTNAPAPPEPVPANPVQPPAPAPTDIRLENEAKSLEVRTDELIVQLSPIGASVEKVALVRYHRNKGETEPLVLVDASIAADKLGPRRSMVLRDFKGNAGAPDFEHWPFKLERDDGDFAGDRATRNVVFRARCGDVEVVKTYVFYKGRYEQENFRTGGFDLGLTVTVTNHGKERDSFEYKLVGAAGLIPDEPATDPATINARLAGRDSVERDLEFRTVTAGSAPDEKVDNRLLNKKRTEWAALRGRFFGVILAPHDPQQAIGAFAEPLEPDQADKRRRNLVAGLRPTTITIDPGKTETRRYLLRAGPLIAEQLEDYEIKAEDGKVASRGMVGAVTFSYWQLFDRPSRWMLGLLEWSKNVIGSYGWGIVLMTLLVKLVLHPLQRKGMIITQRNQEKMQALAPKLKEIQEQYKDDSAKLQQATMRLYKEEGFNPAGMALGCLPMVLQAPVWFALYGSILGAFGLRQASFLWISDLSRPDTLVVLSFWPGSLNLLPVLYVGLTLAQSFMTPLPADPQQRQQAWMMRFIPLVFFLFIYSLSSAFVLYFVTNGLLSILETWMIKKQIARAKEKEAAKALVAGAVAGSSGKDVPKPAPISDPSAFWAKEGEAKLGKGKK